MTAYRSLVELDINIDPTDADQIQAFKDAQCEQALHELKNDADPYSSLELPKYKLKLKEMPRYSERAVATLKPYFRSNSVAIIR